MAPFGRDSGRIELDQKRALWHPIRFRIWSLFMADPDCPPAALAVHTALTKEEEFREVTVSQVYYHLARLREAQLIPAA